MHFHAKHNLWLYNPNAIPTFIDNIRAFNVH